MTDTYAVGIHETDSDSTIYFKVAASDNKTFYTALAESLVLNAENKFSVSDVLYDLKTDFRVLGVYVDDIPTADHTLHVYDEAARSVELIDKDTLDHKHTFDVFVWAARYGVKTGIPVH